MIKPEPWAVRGSRYLLGCWRCGERWRGERRKKNSNGSENGSPNGHSRIDGYSRVMVISELRLTTAGEVFSAIEAKALPIRRRVAMLSESWAKTDKGLINNRTKMVEITI
ncbi:hypothetical protein ES703_120695 [subsurface metagenome]